MVIKLPHPLFLKLMLSMLVARCLIIFILSYVGRASKVRSWLGGNVLVQGYYPEARNSGCLLVELNGFLYVFGGSSSSGIMAIFTKIIWE